MFTVLTLKTILRKYCALIIDPIFLLICLLTLLSQRRRSYSVGWIKCIPNKRTSREIRKVCLSSRSKQNDETYHQFIV